MIRAIAEWWSRRRRSAARRMADRWMHRAEAMSLRLDRDRRAVRRMARELEDLLKRVELDNRETAELLKDRETALEALKNENVLYADVALPLATDMLRRHQEAVRADTALMVCRQAALTQTRGE